MDALIDGWKQQPVALTRTEHPSGLKLAEPTDAFEPE